MLLIHCPYCDETLPEMEFAYAGEAHIARPVDPNAVSDEDWRDYLFVRSNRRGPACRALAPRPRLRLLLQRRARHGDRPVARRPIRPTRPGPTFPTTEAAK